MNFFTATPESQREFYDQGYVLVRNLFLQDEITMLSRYARADQQVAARATSRTDASGGTTTLALSNELEDNLYSAVVRSRRVANNMATLLGDEVYHYHHKMMLKEPFVGGAWEWHQDYGYWYNNGCLFPLMASVMVALDRCTKENGCLQVLKGSHHLGRIDHGLMEGQQVGADPKRLDEILKRMEIVYAEMEPGDGLFFHCNTLHRSDQNRSPDRRWTMLFCYNAARNNPYREHHHPMYTPLVKVDDDAIKTAGLKFAAGAEERFLNQPFAPPDLKAKIENLS